MSQPRLSPRWLAATTLAIGLTLWAQTTNIGLNGPVLPNPGNPGMSRQQQIQAGDQAAQQVYKQMPVLPDSSPITKYVQQLGAKLVRQIPSQYSWPYQFHVIQESDINAFALPGGPVFINVGTITAAANEAQLAGVIGHEMSHVYLQHSAKAMVAQSKAQIGLGILGAILGNGTAADIAKTVAAGGANLYFLKYSRGDEAQADATGAIIIYKAGYDPRAMAQFFQKLEKQAGSGGSQFLSDHPNPGNRVAAVDREIAHWPPENYTPSSPQFLAAKQEAQQVKAYTAQQIATGAKQGIWAKQNQADGAVFRANGGTATAANPKGGVGSAAGVPSGSATNPNAPSPSSATPPSALASVTYSQVKPSGTMQTFQGSVFTIQYPSNWQASTDPSTGGATIAPAAGAAAGTVAYGVVVGGTSQSVGDLNQATQQLIQSLQQSNSGMSVSGSPTQITVAGQQAESVNLTSTSPVTQNGQPEQEHDWLVTVPRPQGGMLYLIFIAPQNSFHKLQGTYRTMLNSLQVQ
jgi:hypothetical protein